MNQTDPPFRSTQSRKRTASLSKKLEKMARQMPKGQPSLALSCDDIDEISRARAAYARGGDGKSARHIDCLRLNEKLTEILSRVEEHFNVAVQR